ncbi:hypothetical protein KR50_17210 [Jeotgalibacillus campisalis]|uniref:Uncharacterized protein n=1 Tax=Jeotgalibacillus campisalis TaxID=220754 RepID=A0A0C2S0J3_9BACL|nr:hypothetical protein KR50_17210 [Jeotgalibacillus campisalis]
MIKIDSVHEAGLYIVEEIYSADPYGQFVLIDDKLFNIVN